MKKITIIILIAAVIFVGVQIYLNFIGLLRYGKSYNETRVELGVPIIEENFKSMSNYLSWYNESKHYPRHAMKSITTNGFSVEIEQDNFEFLKDSTLITIFSYYNYKQKCYNIYLKEGERERKISCDTMQEILKDENLPVRMLCKECAASK
jgi:hypothetical protein